MTSLQVPLPLSHSTRISAWSSFEVFSWIVKNNEKFGLSQDDIDSIEESPLNGKQLLQKNDEDVSQEWAISIHAARKIVNKALHLERNAKRNRKSEPIINILNGGDISFGNNYQKFATKPTHSHKDKYNALQTDLQHIPERAPRVQPLDNPPSPSNRSSTPNKYISSPKRRISNMPYMD
eukprot:342961_1